jgi:light-regulated signal transduction histidine kinase (bacteriophytochrome)/CheY-like chemotaxis protein
MYLLPNSNGSTEKRQCPIMMDEVNDRVRERFPVPGAPDSMQADLSICDREPITRLERIQSFGFLLAMSRDWRITRASANLAEMLGIDISSALGATLDTLLDKESLHEMRNRMVGLSMTGGVERMYGIKLVEGRSPFDVAIHYAGDLCVLEGEPAGLDNRMDAASLVRKMVARLNTLPSVDAFHRDAARQVRALTGFDRIMVYRFAADGVGEVIAEVAKPGMESYLGLHYPASDIPLQARALYLRNSFRIIADVRAETVPLVSSGGEMADPMDLSLAVTRAVSPVHIEYLRNMGVGASVSISIIIEGKLWGLIACHHANAKLPTFVTRTAAELFGQMYSMTLESRLRLSADNHDRHGREAITQMLKAIAGNYSLLRNAGWLLGVIRGLIQCDGIAAVMDGEVFVCGAAPQTATIGALAIHVNDLAPGEVFVTSSLGVLHPKFSQDLEVAAGALFIPTSHSRGDYLILFRREQLRDIRWAGEPHKAALPGDETARLSPRKSFAVFVQSVRDQSRPFNEGEQRLADSIRTGLVDVILRGSHDGAVERARASGRQEILIAELNHRVRNVLALIRGLISQTRGEGADSAKYVESLNGRVQALARAHDRVTQQNWGPGRLNAIFDDEIAAYVPTQRDRFTISGPLVLLQPQAYSTMALIIHELVTNSCKYGALCDSGRVIVTLSPLSTGGLRVNWVERGGPAVEQPTRRGFGSVIIERVVPFDLQGTATVSYLPAGLEAEFFIPERYVAASSTEIATLPTEPLSSSSELGSAAESRPLLGLRVLLLEDHLIVALEAEDLLRSLGAASITAASSIAVATELCDAESFDFAVLDINLGFENSLSFADRLREAKVPFVFASGYGDHSISGESRVAELIVSKPYDRESLSSAVALTLCRQASAAPTRIGTDPRP